MSPERGRESMSGDGPPENPENPEDSENPENPGSTSFHTGAAFGGGSEADDAPAWPDAEADAQFEDDIARLRWAGWTISIGMALVLLQLIVMVLIVVQGLSLHGG